MQVSVYPLILAGGFGCRLFPFSTKDFPKQFLSIGHKTTSMFQDTVNRILTCDYFKKVTITTNVHNKSIMLEQLSSISKDDIAFDFLYEKERLGTAATITVSAMHLLEDSNNPIVVVFPSDHKINNENILFDSINKLVDKIHDSDEIACFGLSSSEPSTQYGYIIPDKNDDIANVKRFVEKPDELLALELFQSDICYWNSGIFIFNVHKYLQRIKLLNPLFYERCKYAYHSINGDNMINDNFVSGSFDHIIMQHYNRCIVMNLNYVKIVDLGSFHSIIESFSMKHVLKPWGFYVNMCVSSKKIIKYICVLPGCCTSLQMHMLRSEHIYLFHGNVKLTHNNIDIIMNKGENHLINANEIHRIKNIGKNNAYLIEVQMGDVLSERDIKRFADDYGRCDLDLSINE